MTLGKAKYWWSFFLIIFLTIAAIGEHSSLSMMLCACLLTDLWLRISQDRRIETQSRLIRLMIDYMEAK